MKDARKAGWLMLGLAMIGLALADVNVTTFIKNPSFEQPGLFPGDSEQGLIGWDTVGGRGVPQTQFPSGAPNASQGNQYAELYGALCTQVIAGAVIQPNTTYTLYADVMVYSAGNPQPQNAWFSMWLDAFETATRLAIFGNAGPTPNLNDLIAPGDPNIPVQDTWYTVSCSFNSASIDPSLIGQTLYVVMMGDYIKVDNIRLIATGTPVNLTVSTSYPAGLLVPQNGPGVYEVGSNWVVKLDAMGKFSPSCPNVYTFSSWAGADNPSNNMTQVTMSGSAKTVTLNYTSGTATCQQFVFPITVQNHSFEEPFTDRYGTQYTGAPGSYGYAQPNLPGWTSYVSNSEIWGYVWNPTGTGGYNHWGTDPINYIGITGVSDGNGALGAWGEVGHAFGVYQNTGQVANEGETVRLTVDLYVSSYDYNQAWFRGAIQFVGAGEQLFFPSVTPKDVWREVVMEATVTAAYANRPIQIELKGAGVWVDNVRLERRVDGVPATVTVSTNPTGVNITPAAGTYTVPLGSYMTFIGDDFDCAPSGTYAFSQWTQGARLMQRPQVRQQSILIDNNISVVGSYQNISACGDQCHPYPTMDFTEDCVVNLADLAEFSKHWLTDTRP